MYLINIVFIVKTRCVESTEPRCTAQDERLKIAVLLPMFSTNEHAIIGVVLC